MADYLPYGEWLDAAKALDEGRRKRIDHVCGSGSTLLISHTEDGYSGHCFRCNKGGFMAHGLRHLSAVDFRLLRKADDAAFNTKELALPKDFTSIIPPAHATWLYRAGVFADTAMAHGFGYSESMSRVILPVYDDGVLVYMQARACQPGRVPKYLNKAGASKGAIMWKGVRDYEDVIVTEDILSALRIYMAGYNAVCTLGTAVSDGQAGYLSRFKRVAFWYDGDKAGFSGSAKGIKTIALVAKVGRIITDKDPKLYSNREITQILKENGWTV